MGDRGVGQADSVCVTEREKLNYMYSMVRELRDMANAEGIDVLTYILGMAKSEIEDILSGRYSPMRTRRPGPAARPKDASPLRRPRVVDRN